MTVSLSREGDRHLLTLRDVPLYGIVLLSQHPDAGRSAQGRICEAAVRPAARKAARRRWRSYRELNVQGLGGDVVAFPTGSRFLHSA